MSQMTDLEKKNADLLATNAQLEIKAKETSSKLFLLEQEKTRNEEHMFELEERLKELELGKVELNTRRWFRSS